MTKDDEVMTAQEFESRRYAYLRKQLELYELGDEVLWANGREGMWSLVHPQLPPVQVYAMRNGELFVRGEFGPCYFAAAASDSAYKTLEWLGRTSDTAYYAAQKAQIAMNSLGFNSQVFDAEQALRDLKERGDCSESFLEEVDCCDTFQELVELAVHHREKWAQFSENAAAEHLAHVGNITHSAVVRGHAVVRRCYALVKARNQAKETPPCTPTDTSATP